ncbi:MAG: prepilin-type N-terminal cleavage/methylation domain-containing protein [Armatimonadetes bacterium]|nr:prepilin-type N-terminal cleavage/methylation domain-containing protein [Armatimonadota bacterium]
MIDRRGFSLVEVVVASGLLGLLTLVLALLLTPGLRIWNLSQTRSEAEQAMMLAEGHLGEELMETAPSSVQTVDDPGLSALSFLSPGSNPVEAYDPITGAPTWRQLVVYYLSSGTLYRKQWQTGSTPPLPYVLPASKPFQVQPDELRLLCVPDGTERRVCAGLDELELFVPGDGTLILSLEVNLETQNGPETFRRSTTVYARNGDRE